MKKSKILLALTTSSLLLAACGSTPSQSSSSNSSFVDNSSYFFSGDSVQDAITYFGLYVDEATARLKRRSESEKIVNGLGISADTADFCPFNCYTL